MHCSPPSRYRREWRGIFVLGGESVTSVSVFIDYENTRFGARECLSQLLDIEMRFGDSVITPTHLR